MTTSSSRERETSSTPRGQSTGSRQASQAAKNRVTKPRATRTRRREANQAAGHPNGEGSELGELRPIKPGEEVPPPELIPIKLEEGKGEPAELGGLTEFLPRPSRNEWSAPRHLAESRKFIACWLLAILSFVVLAACLFVGLGIQVQVIKDLMAFLLAPIVGLVGAATGFYFGEKERHAS
jgi:hypothetical protein